MKIRETIYPQVKIIKPLFWKECRFCNCKFKREMGYKITDYTVVNPQLYDSFCCNECADNIEKAREITIKSKIITRPRPPKSCKL